MKERFWLFKRGNVFYFQDSTTGKQHSLGTKDRNEAERLLEIKRQTTDNPSFNQLILKTCLVTQDTEFATRKWSAVMTQLAVNGKESTKARCERAMKCSAFDWMRNRKLIETTATDFLVVLARPEVSVHHYLRRLHNLALGLGWISSAVLPSRLWPKVRFKEKRAITRVEHERILQAERNPERNLYYQLLWEIGASQSDAAELQADQIDWKNQTLSYRRKKTGEWAQIMIGNGLKQVLKQLPTEGALFPAISQTSENDRSAEFYRRCKLLGIQGISLHSYRYAWAQSARSAGYPERFAQGALGHGSKAVHRAYARGAHVMLPSLEAYENLKAAGTSVPAETH